MHAEVHTLPAAEFWSVFPPPPPHLAISFLALKEAKSGEKDGKNDGDPQEHRDGSEVELYGVGLVACCPTPDKSLP